MNEIFENNKFTTRAHNFYNLYRTPIIAIVVILLITVFLFLAMARSANQTMRRLQKYIINGPYKK